MTKLFVIAREDTNVTGHPVFEFSQTPYVHRSEQGVEQEARRLARMNEQSYAVFSKEYTVQAEVVDKALVPIDAEKLVNNLTLLLLEQLPDADFRRLRNSIEDVLARAQILSK